MVVSRTDSNVSHHPVAEFRLTPAVAVTWLFVSVAGFFAFAYGFGALVAALGGRSLDPIVIPALSATGLTVRFVAAFVLVPVVVSVHELLHGVFMARYGGEPSYGMGVSRFFFPTAYAETGSSFTRTELLVVLLAPFVVITATGLAAALVVPSSVLVFVLAVNAAGSIGDLWMAGVLLQYAADARVAGLPAGSEAGFAVYARSDEAVTRRPGSALLAKGCAGAVGTVAVIVAAALAAVFLSLVAGSGTVVVGDPGSRWFVFSHERLAGGGAALEVGTPFVVGASAVGGVGWALVTAATRGLE